MYLQILSVLLATAQASPLEAKANPFCSVVTKAVTKLSQQSAATAYCSSYLSIKIPATVTSTVTDTSTSTVAVGPTRFPQGQNCFSGSNSDKKRDLEVVDALHVNALEARQPQPAPLPTARAELHQKAKPKPKCFSAYTASGVISSACKCLSIPHPTAPTTTVTTTTATTTSVQAESTNFIIRDETGNYAVASGDEFNGATFNFTANAANADTFSFASVCNMVHNPCGNYLWFDTSAGGGPVSLYRPGPSGYSVLRGNIDISNDEISTTDPYSTTVYAAEDNAGLWNELYSDSDGSYSYFQAYADPA